MNVEFEKTTLANGLELILSPDHRVPLVAVNLWYHVGPANEEPGRTGFAHLFEHMMFQGSGHVPEAGHFGLLERAGASLVNGTTDFDRTNYMEDVPANQLELALWLESDRMGFLLDRLDEAKLANQQDVVRNERRQTVENAPYGLVDEGLWQQLFPPGHPYHANVIGSHEDIQAARLADVREFFARYYCPNNASLSLAGDFDPARARELVERYFGTLPRGRAVPPISAVTPPIRGERRGVVPDRVELPRVVMGWISAPIFTPGDADAHVAARILGGGKASRLYRALVYERQLAQSVSAAQQSLALGSVFQLVATARPGHDAAELEAAIDQELARFAAEGPREDEVAAARTSIRAEIVTGLEHLGDFEGVANRLNLYNHYLRDPGYLPRDLARLAEIDRAAVRAFAAGALGRERRVVIHGVPGDKVVAPGPPTPAPPAPTLEWPQPGDPWRSEPPPPGPLAATTLPSPLRFDLPNGLPVFLVPSHHLPVVAAHLVVRAGSAGDPAGREGLAGFAAAMLDEGAGERDALGIACALEANGASLGTGAGYDGSTVSARALKERVGDVLSIVSDVVLRPTFPPAEIERVRQHRLTALLQQRDVPFQTALRVFGRQLYGHEHPYGHTTLGARGALESITRDELVAFYRAAFVPANAALILAGDLTEDEARRLATDAFGAWGGGGGPPPEPPAPAFPGPQVVLVDRPGAPQSAVLAGQVAIRRSHPDFEALSLMNEVLGGLFTSRLNLNLREDKGYTYGAWSALPERRGASPLFLWAMVRSDATGASVREMIAEITRMRAAPLEGRELSLAKESVVRSLPARFETTGSVVGTIGALYLLDQPADFYRRLPARLEAITSEQVFEATRRHLDPARLLVVVVGDVATVRGQLEGAVPGPMVEVGADGEPPGAGD